MDADCQGTPDCVPGTGPVGSACTANTDCVANGNDPLCIVPFPDGTFPGGYCSEQCDFNTGLGCSTPGVCVPVAGDTLGICFAPCTPGMPGACRTGYECQDDGNGNGLCVDAEDTASECTDFGDNDGDGLADCQDPSCAALPICQPGAQAPGTACTVNSQCSVQAGNAPMCITEAQFGWPFGSCSQWCDPATSGSCPSGLQCEPVGSGTQGLCLAPCTGGGTMCGGRPGYYCGDNGTGGICYGYCQNNTECNSGYCELNAASTLYARCTNGEVCGNDIIEGSEGCDPPGPGCSAGCQPFEGVCDDLQDNDADNLLDCEDPDCAGTAACTPGPTAAGQPCTATNECQSVSGADPFCVTEDAFGFPMGTCSEWCDVVTQTGCPAGFGCVDPPFGTGGLCLRLCNFGGTECNARPGYACNADATNTTGVCLNQCTDGSQCASTYCETNPALDNYGRCMPIPQCGNSVLEGTEECDPPGPGCTMGCVIQELDCVNITDDDGDGLLDCSDSDCAGGPDCLPGANAPGDACTANTDCQATGGDPLCLPDGLNFPGGYCSEFCTPDAQQGPGTGCTGNAYCAPIGDGTQGICYAGCQPGMPGTCRAGYTCGTFFAGSPQQVSLCVPPESDCADLGDNDGNGLLDCADPSCQATPECAPGTTPVGGPCGVAADCASAVGADPVCLSEVDFGHPGGQCGEFCTLGGTDCPSGSACAALGPNVTHGLCVETCVQPADCSQPGYGCDNWFNPDANMYCIPGCTDDTQCTSTNYCEQNPASNNRGRCTDLPQCGNGDVQGGEQCDPPGVGADGLGCSQQCNRVPNGWTCDQGWYGANDGCDCGCGIPDPDCADGAVGTCTYCWCGTALAGTCPGQVDPGANALCQECTVGSTCASGTCNTGTCAAATVASSSPAPGTSTASATPDIVITFTGPVLPGSLSAQVADGPCSGAIQLSADGFATCVGMLSGLATVSAGDTVATTTPAAALQPGATYTVRVIPLVMDASAKIVPFYQGDPGFMTAAPACTPSQVVISEVYGGGGNSGATYTHDFIELHNRSTTQTVNLGGWSVQYASASGTSWTVTTLSGTVAPGGYYLVQEGAGAGGTTALPTPDAVGTIGMSGTSGKVALVSATTPLAGPCPVGAPVVDFVGFGTANCSEGGTTTPAFGGNANSVQRAGMACADTDNNGADFVALPAAPQNTTATPNTCACN